LSPTPLTSDANSTRSGQEGFFKYSTRPSTSQSYFHSSITQSSPSSALSQESRPLSATGSSAASPDARILSMNVSDTDASYSLPVSVDLLSEDDGSYIMNESLIGASSESANVSSANTPSAVGTAEASGGFGLSLQTLPPPPMDLIDRGLGSLRKVLSSTWLPIGPAQRDARDPSGRLAN